MKYVIVLPDGAADEPVAALNNLTPLVSAQTPNIDWISSHGRQGCVVTVPDGFQPGTDVATLSLLGYDPHVCYSGRAPLEAVARGVTASSDQLIFRCNFVTIVDGVMEDFSAGHISDGECRQLIDDLNKQLSQSPFVFHAGVSYRNLMVASDIAQMKARCTPPHDIPGQAISKHIPKGKGADKLAQVMSQAHDILAEHDVNKVRRDLGENPATDIWLWGYGQPASLEPLTKRFGISGACIAAVDLIRGIASCAGLSVLDVDGATGYLDTDYAAKGAAVVGAIDEYDLVVVHIEAPDEAGHLGDAAAKVTAIEQIDAQIVGPVLEKLRGFDQWRIMIAPDHPTPVESRVHSMTPPPFCLAGHLINPVLNRPFSEANASESDLQIDPGHELLEFFLRH